MIRDIVVNLEHQIARDPASDFAISIAETFGAHVLGVAFAYAPEFPAYMTLEIPASIVTEMIADSEKAALAAIERFDAAARRNNIAAEQRLSRTIGTGAPAALSTLARRSDLSVFMQSDPDIVDNDEMIETSLFWSGRPLIVVPHVQKSGLKLDRVVCCWDDSPAAARAINDAIPLLAKATAVDLLIVLNEKTERDKEEEIHGADIARHLARHDIKANIQIVPAAGVDVASTILSYVADNSGTMVVMGGYGRHGRLREMILGGTTRDMLKSMTVPVLLSH